VAALTELVRALHVRERHRLRDLHAHVSACHELGYPRELHCERMRAFNRDTPGFSVYRDWDGWCELRVGNTLLTLRQARTTLRRTRCC
jgi:hypothetical protein